jgi:FlaA1/EpsC-like NDP-sugar epimerase
MGEPIRIGDLAERFIAAATPMGQPAVGIDIIGLRPGEKMREELTTQGLTMRSTDHPRIWSARQLRIRRTVVVDATLAIRRAVTIGDASAALTAVHTAVEDFMASAEAWASARAGRRPAADAAHAA